MLGALEVDPMSPMGDAGGFPREHPCPTPGTCCPGPTEWFGLYLVAQQTLGKCLNLFWIWVAFESNQVSPLRDGVLGSHGFFLNVSLICPSPQKAPADPLLLPLCVCHRYDPQSFFLELKELEIGWVLLPLGNKIFLYCAAQGERNFFLPSVCCNKVFCSSLWRTGKKHLF